MESGMHNIQNTAGTMKASKFTEICFRVKDDFIDITTQKVNIRKKSFVFRTNQHCKIKANDSAVIGIKCSFPKSLTSGDYLGKAFSPFTKFLLNNFLLKFKRSHSCIQITNYTSKTFNIKGNTALGSLSFDFISDISKGRNTITHYHTALDSSIV